MYKFWNTLHDMVLDGKAGKNEVILFKKSKTFKLLSFNPKHPSLNSHEISQLSIRYGLKVF